MGETFILVPAYNAAGTIAATLESVQAQTRGLDGLAGLHLADDGSRDDTATVARAVWNAGVPLHILNSDGNRGQWSNVNRALLHLSSSAEWVLLLHADDLAKPNWLECMLSRIRNCGPRVASICASWESLLPDGRVVGGEEQPSRPVEVIDGTWYAVRDTVVKGCWWHISGCAIRLPAFRDIGPFNPDLDVADWEWLLRCLGRGWQVEYIPRILIQYRQHAASVSSASFLRDRDIQESLALCQRYAPLLSFRQRCEFHLRRATYAIRRFGRAILRRQPKRALVSARSLGLVGASLTRCVAVPSRRYDL
jgi:glycosyltransferase involved in cell wall biosynthesis